MENNILTAEELYFKVTSCVMNHKDIKTAMIEFAKLHCEAQLKAILENVKTKEDPYSYTGNTGSEYPPDIIVDKNSIIKAYNFNNIK
jgi:hypothetical protein